MPTTDRWPVEMQMLQESIVWLVPDAELARTLVGEAGIPEGFIDFGEPVWNRIKRIMVEAEKREMMAQLLAVITSWYPENTALGEAKAAWEAGQDRKAAAAAMRKAARAIPDPVAVATVTRKGALVTDVAVDVTIPEVEESALPKTTEKLPVEMVEAPEEFPEEIPYSDDMTAGDWFSAQKTMGDHEQRLRELETWRRQLSIMPTVTPTREGSGP